MENPKDAIVAMHAYEALAEYVDAGLDKKGNAARLMYTLYDQWEDAWHKLPPICGDYNG